MEVLSRPAEERAMSLPVRPSAARAGRSLPLRLAFLDGLRALACLAVVFHHLLTCILDPAAPRLPSGSFRYLLAIVVCGRLAVAVFIVISGFCLMLPVIRADGCLPGGAARFFRKRARRILPPYHAALLVALLLVPVRVEKWDLLSHVLLLHNLSLAWFGSINGVLWSIAVEWQIYLWFPLLVWAWRRFGAARSVGVVVGVAGLLSQSLLHTRWCGLMPHFYILFALGMIAAAIAAAPGLRWRFLRESVPWGMLAASLTAALALTIILLRFGRCCAGIRCLELLTGPVTLSVLVAASRPEAGRLRRFLEWRPLVAIGSFSYSIYLVHWCLLYHVAIWFQRSVWPAHHLPLVPTYFAVAALVVPPVLGACYLFYLVFERPFVHH